ncbi:hypothetical protein JCM10296v2_006869 [Rhodotorula toruloides]
MKLHFAQIAVFLALARTAVALPAPMGVASAAKRQYKLGNIPYFPQKISSCVACQPDWTSISSCARVAPAFKDWKQTLYPQCVDCVVQTNQCEEYLGVPSLEANSSSIIDGMRNVCGFGQLSSAASRLRRRRTTPRTPNQGYPTATSTGVGGMDYGSAEGGKSGAARLHTGVIGGALAAAFGMAGSLLL